MRLALVTCFNAEWHHGRVPSPYLPLNLLTLAAETRQAGHQPVIVDQTLALLRGEVSDGPRFHEDMAAAILALKPEVIGLATMCNSYPQTLALAGRCRDLDPTVRIVLGGPQATAVDLPTLQHFPCVDAVIRNEADGSLNEALAAWGRGDDLAATAGVTWRASDSSVVRNPNAPLLAELDPLPYPAYDLYPFDQIQARLAPVEAGRGCPYGCTFCSTNLYFNRRYRIKSPQRLVTELLFLREAYGFEDFDLVHDMLTVDRRWVREFCRVLADGNHGLRWNCSARIDRVDEELLTDMAATGCEGMFFGVETGAQRMQPLVLKRLRVEQVMPVMRSCVERRIAPVGSFITGFPQETTDDALESFNLALDIVQLSPDTRAQMHLLAPLVGSPLHAEHHHELRFDGHSSDISLFLLSEPETDLIRAHPEIFPNFYYIPTPELDREVAKAISAATYTCPELFIALRLAGADLRSLFTEWPRWQRRQVDARLRQAQDYYLYRFAVDLCDYLAAEVVPALAPAAAHLPDLVAYTQLGAGLRHGLVSDATVFRTFDHDVQALAASLRSGDQPPTVRPAEFDLLFVNLAAASSGGHLFLEVAVPRQSEPLVLPGDRLEVRDPVRQLLNRPDIIIRNNSQRRAFAARHHVSQRQLAALRRSGVAVGTSAVRPGGGPA